MQHRVSISLCKEETLEMAGTCIETAERPAGKGGATMDSTRVKKYTQNYPEAIYRSRVEGAELGCSRPSYNDRRKWRALVESPCATQAQWDHSGIPVKLLLQFF